jgi:hypothetical protein
MSGVKFPAVPPPKPDALRRMKLPFDATVASHAIAVYVLFKRMPRLRKLKGLTRSQVHVVAPLPVATQKRLLQSVGVVEKARSAGPARTEATARERMFRVSLQLRHPAVLHMGEESAFPEAELTERRNHLVAVRFRVVDDVGIETPPLREGDRPDGDRCGTGASDPDELATSGGHRPSFPNLGL